MAFLNLQKIKAIKDLTDYPILYGIVWPTIIYPCLFWGFIILFGNSFNEVFEKLFLYSSILFQLFYLLTGLILTQRYSYLFSLIAILLWYGIGFYIAINMN